MTPTTSPSWSSKGLLAVLRDTLPEHDLAFPETLGVEATSPWADALGDAAKQARIERMGRRLRQLVQTADVSSTSAVAA